MPGLVLGDPTRLRQVLLNLLINALKFTPSGRIDIALRRREPPESDLLHFQAADTGVGIALDQQPLLFHDFVQIGTSIRRECGGTGLGLAISQRLVDAMGGKIGATSAPGAGSTFWFTARLPTAEPPADATPPGSLGPSRPDEQVVSRRVLVADDNTVNQIVINELLRRVGHHVVLVADGKPAIAAVQAPSFDIVFMDMRMPVMDGVTATRAIRALDSAARTTPIIALTANVTTEEVACCHDAGMNGHLGKPIDRAQLRRAIADWASGVSTARPN